MSKYKEYLSTIVDVICLGVLPIALIFGCGLGIFWAISGLISLWDK